MNLHFGTISLENTPEVTVHDVMKVCTPPGNFFIAVQKLATAGGDLIDLRTKSINLNFAKSHEIQALIRKPSTWSSDIRY
jgi:hypothetical protein